MESVMSLGQIFLILIQVFFSGMIEYVFHQRLPFLSSYAICLYTYCAPYIPRKSISFKIFIMAYEYVKFSVPYSFVKVNSTAISIHFILHMNGQKWSIPKIGRYYALLD